jgi:hypothetical protein
VGSEPGATRAGKRTWALLVLAVVDALGAAYAFCPPRGVPSGPLEIIGGGWQDLDAPHNPREIYHLALCITQAHDG